MKILCVYATRQIDSNLFMSSTIFNGLQQCGYEVDMLFCGTEETCQSLKKSYGHYFDNVFYLTLSSSLLLSFCKKQPVTQIAYNYYRGFVMDSLVRPYSMFDVRKKVVKQYDQILAFVPIALAAYLANDVRKYLLPKARLVQYWTDPLSLGRLDDIHNIPWTRRWHQHLEKSILKLMDKAVFCYPLFCDCMKELYPQHADKMSWADIAYTKHEKANYKPSNAKVTVGLFGAYQQKVRNIFPFLETIKEMPDVQFVMRGDSDITINPADYPNLDVKPGRVPLAEVEELEANCDILLCLAGRSGITIPAGKVFYYGDYNKPILYIGDGVHKDYCAEYLRSFGRYEVCDNTMDSIKQGIKNCMNQLEGYEVIIPERIEPRVIARKMVEQ